MFGIADECDEELQDRTLRAIDIAWGTQLFPCEVVEQRQSPSPRIEEGWNDRIWWVRNGDSLIHQIDPDDELYWHCCRVLLRGKATGDRSVIEEIKEAIRLQQVAAELRLDEFELIDVLTTLKGF